MSNNHLKTHLPTFQTSSLYPHCKAGFVRFVLVQKARVQLRHFNELQPDDCHDVRIAPPPLMDQSMCQSRIWRSLIGQSMPKVTIFGKILKIYMLQSLLQKYRPLWSKFAQGKKLSKRNRLRVGTGHFLRSSGKQLPPLTGSTARWLRDLYPPGWNTEGVWWYSQNMKFIDCSLGNWEAEPYPANGPYAVTCMSLGQSLLRSHDFSQISMLLVRLQLSISTHHILFYYFDVKFQLCNRNFSCFYNFYIRYLTSKTTTYTYKKTKINTCEVHAYTKSFLFDLEY